MVGSMCGSSLAAAPHHVVAQLADLVDIDGPLLLKNDRIGGLIYDRGMVSLPAGRFWGQ
jgi:L-alanine-DL-glutamate epimerase-like enolase superfamily enzyme